ncbi:MAG: hypothetical protein J6S00_03190 [Clostridia bacterium]|nr:hypothetical protein [Clostridia bacterium]
MKRFIAVCLLLACCLCMNGFISMPKTTVKPESPAVSTVTPDANLVENARIENLLNLNNVYGDDFLSNEKLTNLAAIALRSYADKSGFINEALLTTYVKDLYDIDLVITDDINADMPKKDGYVYLIPRGFAKYAHTVTSVEDFTDFILVTSDVTVYYHDGGQSTGVATTILVKNENAVYGYNIIDSNIVFNA